jgi:hypothetical protein
MPDRSPRNPCPGVPAVPPRHPRPVPLGVNPSDCHRPRHLPTVEGMTNNVITLNNGVEMPALGLGVDQLDL